MGCVEQEHAYQPCSDHYKQNERQIAETCVTSDPKMNHKPRLKCVCQMTWVRGTRLTTDGQG